MINRSLCHIVFLAGLLLAAGVEAQALQAAWLKVGDDAMQHWQVVPDDSDPYRLSIQRKGKTTGSNSKHILVLVSRASSAYDTAMTRLLMVFNERKLDVDFTIHNYQNKVALGQSTMAGIQKQKFSLIYAMGSESTALLFDHFNNIATPVVSVCAKDPVLLGQMRDYVHGSGKNFAFTSLNLQVEGQLGYMLELKPQLKNIAILVDSRNSSAVQTQSDPIAAIAMKRGINAIKVAIANPAEAAAELSQQIPVAIETMKRTDPDLKNSIFWITGSTSVFAEIETINRYAGKVPVLSVVPEVVAEGDRTAVLSIGVSFDSNAHLAAIYGIDILTGKAKPGAMKVGVVSPPDIAISFRKAREIDLKIPFSFFEKANTIYDYAGKTARAKGILVSTNARN